MHSRCGASHSVARRRVQEALDRRGEQRRHELRHDVRRNRQKRELALDQVDPERAPEVERAARERAEDRHQTAEQDRATHNAPNALVGLRREEEDVVEQHLAEQFKDKNNQEAVRDRRKRHGETEVAVERRRRQQKDRESGGGEPADNGRQKDDEVRPSALSAAAAGAFVAQVRSDGDVRRKVHSAKLAKDKTGRHRNDAETGANAVSAQRRSGSSGDRLRVHSQQANGKGADQLTKAFLQKRHAEADATALFDLLAIARHVAVGLKFSRHD